MHRSVISNMTCSGVTLITMLSASTKSCFIVQASERRSLYWRNWVHTHTPFLPSLTPSLALHVAPRFLLLGLVVLIFIFHSIQHCTFIHLLTNATCIQFMFSVAISVKMKKIIRSSPYKLVHFFPFCHGLKSRS